MVSDCISCYEFQLGISPVLEGLPNSTESATVNHGGVIVSCRKLAEPLTKKRI